MDGVDLDNERACSPTASPDGNFVQVIKALCQELDSDKTISLPVYIGASRDAYLQYVKDGIDSVFTMTYRDGYDAQI